MAPLTGEEPIYPMGTVHEPDAPLLSAEDLEEDRAVMRTYMQRKQATVVEQAIHLRIPLSVVLDAIKQMDLLALREVADQTAQQLALRNLKI